MEVAQLHINFFLFVFVQIFLFNHLKLWIRVWVIARAILPIAQCAHSFEIRTMNEFNLNLLLSSLLFRYKSQTNKINFIQMLPPLIQISSDRIPLWMISIIPWNTKKKQKKSLYSHEYETFHISEEIKSILNVFSCQIKTYSILSISEMTFSNKKCPTGADCIAVIRICCVTVRVTYN